MSIFRVKMDFLTPPPKKKKKKKKQKKTKIKKKVWREGVEITKSGQLICRTRICRIITPLTVKKKKPIITKIRALFISFKKKLCVISQKI